MMKRHHNVSNLKFEGDLLILTIDGEQKKFKLSEISYALSQASDKERSTYDISPSGYGIHWPLLDEDISIDGLLGIVHTPDWKREIA